MKSQKSFPTVVELWRSFASAALFFSAVAHAIAADAPRDLLPKPGLYKSLAEPPCSYCSTENRKGLIAPADRWLAGVRGPHNGGTVAFPPLFARPAPIYDTLRPLF